MLTKLLKISIVTASALVVLTVFGWIELYRFQTRAPSTDVSERIVYIEAGQDLGRTADELYREGIIASRFKFKVMARLAGVERRLKAGEYSLSPHMTPREIMETLVSGRVRLLRLTVPEGYTLKQIAALFEEQLGGDRSAFVKAANDPSFVQEMNIVADTFEGYLFPDTYYFPRRTSPRTVIRTMVDRFRSVFTPAWEARATQLGFSIHQTVILASMIEKETGVGEERPLIASVFHNRLKKRMRLESDPTVIYGVAEFDGNLTRKHLRTRTPYNTYAIRGLPAGPIANPGKQALEAALYPADTKYLYFVSKKDSTHQFSTNFNDHNRAVRKYQLRRR